MQERRIPDPLLVASDLRVDVDGVPGCEGLSFRTKGEHVLVLGAPRALFTATIGLAPVTRGSLAIRGVSSEEAVGYGLIAGVALDPPLPPRWSVFEYVEWSARLSGAPRTESKSAADHAIERLKLGPLARTQIQKLIPHARRATVIAAALAACTEIVALEDPLAGLPEDVAATFGPMLVAALAERAWIVFAPRIALASPIALAANDAIVLAPTRVEGQGAPAELASGHAVSFPSDGRAGSSLHATVARHTWVARLEGKLGPVKEALAARGATMEEAGPHVLLDLAGTTTSELAGICAAADVAIVELMPVSRPIARAFL